MGSRSLSVQPGYIYISPVPVTNDCDVVFQLVFLFQTLIPPQELGRKRIRGTSAIPHFVRLLDSDHPKVRLRSAGALHNVSSDPQAIHVIRRHGGIPKLVRLLSDGCPSEQASAAGALQNTSRETASRLAIKQLDAVRPLADLLSAPDLQARVCAAGAWSVRVGQMHKALICLPREGGA